MKCIQDGQGKAVLNQQGLFHITCHTIHGLCLLNTKEENTPVLQKLDEAIRGFSLGVKGMRKNERRMLYIHPELAYGDIGLIPPNIALIIEVELISL
jgi:peptidylprolyl isomerase